MIPDNSWKILIVEDDRDVHDITEMALRRLVYDNRPLSFINAFSASEAIEQMKNHTDIAIALIDVVMEKDTSGLDLVKIILQHSGPIRRW